MKRFHKHRRLNLFIFIGLCIFTNTKLSAKTYPSPEQAFIETGILYVGEKKKEALEEITNARTQFPDDEPLKKLEELLKSQDQNQQQDKDKKQENQNAQKSQDKKDSNQEQSGQSSDNGNGQSQQGKSSDQGKQGESGNTSPESKTNDKAKEAKAPEDGTKEKSHPSLNGPSEQKKEQGKDGSITIPSGYISQEEAEAILNAIRSKEKKLPMSGQDSQQKGQKDTNKKEW